MVVLGDVLSEKGSLCLIALGLNGLELDLGPLGNLETPVAERSLSGLGHDREAEGRVVVAGVARLLVLGVDRGVNRLVNHSNAETLL